MQVRTKYSIQITGGGPWLPPGSVVELDKADALNLIANEQATALDTGVNIPSEPAVEASAEKDAHAAAVEELSQVNGITAKNVDAIIDAGYSSIKELKLATTAQLKAIPGVTPRVAQIIVADAAEFTTD